MKRLVVKPSRPVAFMGFIGGFCLSLFGILYAMPNLGLFGIIWSVLALLVTLYYAINLFTKKGLPLYKIDQNKKKSK